METCTEQIALNHVLEKMSVRPQEIQEDFRKRKLKMKESKNTHQKHASCPMGLENKSS